MKKTSRILSLILAVLMVISIIPITASAETPTSGTCGDNITWEFDETKGTLTISGTGEMYRYDCYFNASNDEADDRPWWSYTSKIKNIIINEGVTTISEKAFYDFKYLCFVTIPSSVICIEDDAFYSWKGIMAVNYLGSEEKWNNVNIGYGNADLYNSEKFYFKDDYVPVSGSGTYGDNLTWTYDASTSTLTFFGTGAMEGFAGDGGIFSEPNFFDGIRPWEDYEFEVKHIVISEGITSIGKNAFAMFINLESVEIPCSITQIGSYSFGYCINLTDVYYSGTENDWNNIIKGDIFPGLNLIGNSYNVQLDNATKHYDYHTHDYKVSVTEPTCTEQGYTTYTCVCGDTYVVDYVNALGHTDNNNGFCDICNKYLITSGDCGYNLIWTFDESTGTLTISGTGEMYNDEHQYCMSWDAHIDSIESVIISEGVTTIGKSAFDYHKNIKNVSIADSVTEIGERAFYNCTGLTEVVIGKGVTEIGDFAFEDCSNLKTVTIYNAVEEICRYAFNGCSKLTDVYYLGTEAEWNAIKKATLLSKTGLENATIHFLGEETHECSYNAVVTPPTCTEQGYTTYTCECGDSYVSDYIDATGHNYNAVVTAPTCTEEGYTTHTCTACGRKYKDDYTPNNGHKYNMAESKVKEATCTEGGYRYVQCLNCDFIFYYNIVDAKGHWYEDQTVILPTCTEPGYIYSVCECGEYFEDYVDALGHTEEKIPAVAPTCTETGLTAGTKCSVCGETVKEQETVPAKGHKYTPVTTIPATHTTTGIMTYICNCGDRYTKVIEKLDAHHNYKSVITAPTCTEQGYTTYTCSCGDTYIRDYVDATGHNYNAVVTAPTCTEQGYTTYTCDCGDSYIADYVDELGHTEDTITAVAPTCTETGLTEGAKCSVCGETLTEQKELPANGHTPANAVEENYVAPTCTENGSKDLVIYCSVCDEEISRETETLEATGHADNDGDGYCDADNELLDPLVECECNCHKTGISKFFFNLILFFQKLFGSNQVCDCGVAHY